MNNQNDKICWNRASNSIFENFALDLKEYTQTNKLPSYGNQDVNYYLELQHKRLRNKGLIMKYDITPRGLMAEGGKTGRSWSDGHYISNMEFRSCLLSKAFYRDKKKVYEKKQPSIFYQIITNVHNNNVVGGDLYSCPNCGAVSNIAALHKGCPYCGTFFEMTDLFPKVTNFYFINDSGATADEIKHSIIKVIIPCILVSIVGYSLYFYHSPDTDGQLLSSIIKGIIAGIIFGSIGGYFLWAIGKICTLFKGAGKAMPMLFNMAGSKSRFVSQMRQYSPEFSYEYFSDKVVSLLKMIVYSENPQELPNYAGGNIGNLFSDIVESSFTGAVALKKFYVQNSYCYVTVDVYMDDIYDDGRKVYCKNDIFRIDLCKNICKPVNFQFSIKKIQCRNCGSSFDSTKQRNCPSCKSRYELEDDDWFVTGIRKRK